MWGKKKLSTSFAILFNFFASASGHRLCPPKKLSPTSRPGAGGAVLGIVLRHTSDPRANYLRSTPWSAVAVYSPVSKVAFFPAQRGCAI